MDIYIAHHIMLICCTHLARDEHDLFPYVVIVGHEAVDEVRVAVRVELGGARLVQRTVALAAVCLNHSLRTVATQGEGAVLAHILQLPGPEQIEGDALVNNHMYSGAFI
jgi:hypothetical protein